MSDETRVKSTIYVTGLDPATTSDTLYSFFLPFGEIVDVNLPTDKSTAQAKGFGYVEFSAPEDAAAAIDNFDQAELYGKVIKVTQAKNLGGRDGNAGRTEGLGSKVAVWEQDGWLKKHEVDEEDKKAVEQAAAKGTGPDPMEGLEGLDVAGPKPKS
ncbi:Nucleolin [Arthrobotrys entomopaga]|nr:Nucleolin [Arthrobotrys entomopaga]